MTIVHNVVIGWFGCAYLSPNLTFLKQKGGVERAATIVGPIAAMATRR
jgi:hypothetical protein